jgi:hypothetical protein
MNDPFSGKSCLNRSADTGFFRIPVCLESVSLGIGGISNYNLNDGEVSVLAHFFPSGPIGQGSHHEPLTR